MCPQIHPKFYIHLNPFAKIYPNSDLFQINDASLSIEVTIHEQANHLWQ